MATLVLTVIGDDRPGLVKAIAAIVQARGGNWERSQLAQMGGQFAGLVQVSVDAAQVDALMSALSSLDGLEVSVRQATAVVSAADDKALVLDLVGNDRPGIVDEVAGVFTRHGANVEVLETTTSEAPMAGGTLFHAHAEVRVPADADLGAFRADLERLADELMVDVDLEDLGHHDATR